jgi:hypothetical protein
LLVSIACQSCCSFALVNVLALLQDLAIASPKLIAGSMPRTPTIAPLRLHEEWYVVATHPSGQHEHIRRFKTEAKAKSWIRQKSKAWLKKRGTSGTTTKAVDLPPKRR